LFEKEKEKSHYLFDCIDSKKFKCVCGAILNKNEAVISEHKQNCPLNTGTGKQSESIDIKGKPDTVLSFASIEEIEGKLTAMKLIDFSDGYILRKDVAIQYYPGDSSKIQAENMKRDLLFKYSNEIRDKFQLFVTHVELQYGFDTRMKTQGENGIYVYFYCPPFGFALCNFYFYFLLENALIV
jgi:hypothetical protein